MFSICWVTFNQHYILRRRKSHTTETTPFRQLSYPEIILWAVKKISGNIIPITHPLELFISLIFITVSVSKDGGSTFTLNFKDKAFFPSKILMERQYPFFLLRYTFFQTSTLSILSPTPLDHVFTAIFKSGDLLETTGFPERHHLFQNADQLIPVLKCVVFRNLQGLSRDWSRTSSKRLEFSSAHDTDGTCAAEWRRSSFTSECPIRVIHRRGL